MAEDAIPVKVRRRGSPPQHLARALAHRRDLGRADPRHPADLRRRSATSPPRRIRDDFNRELKEAITTLASQGAGDRRPHQATLLTGAFINDFASPNGASVRILSASGLVFDESRGALDLGRRSAGIHDLGEMRVATAAIFSGATGRLAGYVQYGRSEAHIESTIDRLWLLAAAGVFGGPCWPASPGWRSPAGRCARSPR